MERIEYISQRAKEIGIHPAIPIIIALNESGLRDEATGDEAYKCTAKGPNFGKLTPSYGVAQISTCWHPEISIKQSTNFYFAVDFLLQGLKDGKCHSEWSTCPLARPIKDT